MCSNPMTPIKTLAEIWPTHSEHMERDRKTQRGDRRREGCSEKEKPLEVSP